MSFEQPSPRETEVSPEKKGQMWETLRIAALTGLVVFGGYRGIFRHRKEEFSDILEKVGNGRFCSHLRWLNNGFLRGILKAYGPR